ncbi:hypothetical protein COLO4_12734 [Corchorus olitorius]|uniref:Pentatricopeptide repeat-containing protein n=1 Tax=Corchorus olitorius TaxID=93759 RepID=A0A1R3JZU6_9ROSI|nr:hypothetical protein COLO4_12734 [Corchorus olitorius]
MGLLHEGRKLHSHLIKLGLDTVLSLQNHMLNLFVNSKNFYDAEKLFDEMRLRNLVTWNTMICKSSLSLGSSYFKKMLIDSVGFDHITLNGLLRASTELNDVVFGRNLHCLIVKLGFLFDCFVISALVDLYGKCGLVEEARLAFDQVFCKDLVLWNVMVSCYASNSLTKEAFEVFNSMKKEGIKGDGFTFSSLLSSCGSWEFCELARQVHGLIVKLCVDLDVPVASALVDMYAKSGNVDDARKAFDGMTARNVVSWNTMIVGYGKCGDVEKAMELLKEMRLQNFSPDELTLASILSSCGTLPTSGEMRQVHAYVVKNGFESFLSVGNALINAYSKCGSIDDAVQSFVSVVEPDLFTWTSIISAYAFHGLPKESIKIFEKMLATGVRPDGIAFIGILSACSHGGLVSEGLHYFNIMINDFQIIPDSEHYTCLIDLLGRAGLLDEAFNVLASHPIACTPDTLGAFIGACNIHGKLTLAKWAAKILVDLEPNKSVNYALLSNIYAYKGRWSDVANVREAMTDHCDYKIPGCSWMEIAGAVNVFASSDKSHSKALDVTLC